MGFPGDACPPLPATPPPDAFHDANVASINALMAQRARRGLEKYGTDTRREDFDAERWLFEKLCEELDAAIYTLAAINALRRERGEGPLDTLASDAAELARELME